MTSGKPSLTLENQKKKPKTKIMANVIQSVATSNSLTYEIFEKPLLEDPTIESLPFNFAFTTFNSKDLYFNTQLDKIMKKKGNCGWNFQGGAQFTKKTVNPVLNVFMINRKFYLACL